MNFDGGKPVIFGIFRRMLHSGGYYSSLLPLRGVDVHFGLVEYVFIQFSEFEGARRHHVHRSEARQLPHIGASRMPRVTGFL